MVYLSDLKEKMRILYLTHKPIFPVVDGGCKAMLQFLKCLLHLNPEIEHLCLSTHKHPFSSESYPEELNKKLNIENISIDTTVKPRQVLRHLLSRKSYNLARFDSKEAHTYLANKLNSKKYDFIVLESLYCTPYISTIRESSDASIILRSHNVEFKLWEQLSQNTRGYLKKSYLKRLAKDLKQAEIQAYSAVDQLFSISESDKKTIEKLGVKTSITTIPVAMDLQPRKVNDSHSRICFIGSMNWQPNLEAVNILVNELFPRIKENLPSTELHLAGSYMNGQYPTDLEINLINHDFAEDMQVFLRENGVMLLPIRTGSGVRVKILEALSLGVPIVTTPIGALGITDQSALIIGETDKELIQKTLELLHSTEKRKAQGLAAWNYIHSNYGIEQISTKIAQLLNGEQA